MIGSTPSGHAGFAPEWIDLAATIAVAPKACKPYRAKTKGKVERMIRELKEDFLPWLTGQTLPLHPWLFDYDEHVLRWCTEVVGTRRHRTTGRIVAEAWAEERALLRPIPERIPASMTVFEDPPVKRGPESPPEPRWETGWHHGPGDATVSDASSTLRSAGERVEVPELTDYEAVLA